MKIANNPFLAATSPSHVNVRSNNNNNSSVRKLRRQTIIGIGDIGDKCIPISGATALAQSRGGGGGRGADGGKWSKSEEQCQLEQISLQFQGITIYDDDVAKSQSDNNNCQRHHRNSYKSAVVEEEEEMMSRRRWMGTYPACRRARMMMTTTTTTTAAATRMTPKIIPTTTNIRKNHSFHFQTNTACQLHRTQLQQQQQQRGPLIFRPLALSEEHAFKPITTTTTEEEEEEDKSEQSEEFAEEIKQLTHVEDVGVGLHPAASLEVLEALTQSNPELIYSAATQPGSRQNLTAFTTTTTNSTEEEEKLRAKLHAKLLCESEQNPKKFYFGDEKRQEEEEEKLEEESEESDMENSPNATIIMTSTGQVKYMHI